MHSSGRKIAVALVVGLLWAIAAASNGEWPKVKPAFKSFNFTDVEHTDIDLKLYDRSNRAIYAIKCHSGDYDGHHADSNNYSGLIQCYLESLYSKEYFNNLLADSAQQSADWTNRGRFLPNHLLPICRDAPEWGKTRNFRLRGMRVTLSISDIQYAASGASSEAEPVSYTFTVNVESDSSATSAFSEAVKFPEPDWFYKPKACS